MIIILIVGKGVARSARAAPRRRARACRLPAARRHALRQGPRGHAAWAAAHAHPAALPDRKGVPARLLCGAAGRVLCAGDGDGAADCSHRRERAPARGCEEWARVTQRNLRKRFVMGWVGSGLWAALPLRRDAGTRALGRRAQRCIWGGSGRYSGAGRRSDWREPSGAELSGGGGAGLLRERRWLGGREAWWLPVLSLWRGERSCGALLPF